MAAAEAASSLSGLALQQAAKAKPQLKSEPDITELMRGLLFRGVRSERTRLHSGILLFFLVQGGFASGVCRSQVRQTPSEFRPEFAFLDIGLPKLNGYELARRLRDLPAAGQTVLTAITGGGQEEDRRRAREAGFAYHLVKPVESGSIQQILQNARGS